MELQVRITYLRLVIVQIYLFIFKEEHGVVHLRNNQLLIIAIKDLKLNSEVLSTVPNNLFNNMATYLEVQKIISKIGKKL